MADKVGNSNALV